MMFYVDEERKVASWWLSNEEQQDEHITDSLRPQFKEWKAKGYLPVVFRSGNDDLEGCTHDLMKYNFTLEAQQRVEAEKAALAASGDEFVPPPQKAKKRRSGWER